MSPGVKVGGILFDWLPAQLNHFPIGRKRTGSAAFTHYDHFLSASCRIILFFYSSELLFLLLDSTANCKAIVFLSTVLWPEKKTKIRSPMANNRVRFLLSKLFFNLSFCNYQVLESTWIHGGLNYPPSYQAHESTWIHDGSTVSPTCVPIVVGSIMHPW